MSARNPFAGEDNLVRGASKAGTLRVMAAASVLLLSVAVVGAWDFTYGYRSIDDPTAETYLVEKQHAKKFRDWTGDAYWGPNVNDEQATLTYRFSFPAPATEVFLRAGFTLFNYAADQGGRTDYGFTSLWASTNGTSWQLLLDGPTPSEVTATNVVYSQRLPASLLGATTLWIQARLQQHDAMLSFPAPAAAWTDAQFSRANPSNTNEVFQLKARFGPQAQSGIVAHSPGGSWRTAAAIVGAVLCLGMLGLLLVCLGLLCVLVRRSGQQAASNAAVLRRLEQVIQRLEQEPGARHRDNRERRD